MKLYDFNPTADMTILEVASIMKILFVSLIEGIQGQPTHGSDNLQIDDAIYDPMPESLKKYFDEQAPKDAAE